MVSNILLIIKMEYVRKFLLDVGFREHKLFVQQMLIARKNSNYLILLVCDFVYNKKKIVGFEILFSYTKQ